MLMWDLTFVQVISITLNDLPIDWLPIVHNNEYISQGSSLPFLFSFQIHHTVATRKKQKVWENLGDDLEFADQDDILDQKLRIPTAPSCLADS